MIRPCGCPADDRSWTEPVLNSGSAAPLSKINVQEKSDGGKREVALFRKPATGEEGGLMSGRPPSPSRPSGRVLEGEVRGMGRGLRAGDTVPRQSALCPRDPDRLAGIRGRYF